MVLSPEQLDYLRRHSKLRIDREGKWWLDGRIVENDRVQVLFHQGLTIDQQSGDPKLTVGTQWAYVETIDDTAWFVTRVAAVDDSLVATLADERTEVLDPSTLTMASDTDLYCVLSDHRRARFLRAALIDLAPLIEETRTGIGIRLGTAVVDIPME